MPNATLDDLSRDCCEVESALRSTQNFLDEVSSASLQHFAMLSSKLRAIRVLQTALAHSRNPSPDQGFHPLNTARLCGTLTTYSSDTIEAIDVTRYLSVGGGEYFPSVVNLFCGSVSD